MRTCIIFNIVILSSLASVQAQAPDWVDHDQFISQVNFEQQVIPEHVDEEPGIVPISFIETCLSDSCSDDGCCSTMTGCECCGPNWNLSFGGLWLDRISGPSNTVLVGILTGEVASAEDFDPELEFAGGWQINVQKCLGTGQTFEFRYFDVECLDFNGTFTNPNGFGFATTPNLGYFFTNVNGNFRYKADLKNFEWNLRHYCSCNFQILAGIRHFRHDEYFGGTINDLGNPGTSLTANFNADNTMTGGQIGFDWNVHKIDILQFDILGKFGMMHNRSSVEYRASGTGLSAGTNEFVSNDDDLLSFMGELEFASILRVRDHSHIRLSYHLLGITDVSTATAQVTATNRTAPSIGVTRNDVLYHGFSLMYEHTF